MLLFVSTSKAENKLSKTLTFFYLIELVVFLIVATRPGGRDSGLFPGGFHPKMNRNKLIGGRRGGGGVEKHKCQNLVNFQKKL